VYLCGGFVFMMFYAKDSIAAMCDLGSIIVILASVSQQARLRLLFCA